MALYNNSAVVYFLAYIVVGSEFPLTQGRQEHELASLRTRCEVQRKDKRDPEINSG